MHILGVDIGGSGIKGAPVDVVEGKLAAERLRIATPEPSTPEAVCNTVLSLVNHFSWKGPIGCTFPAVIKDGVSHTAANVDKAWIGFNGQALLEQLTGCPVLLLNDADAAGYAELTLGAGRGERGTVMMLTLGTGIGTALFVNGQLLPNTELGHLEVKGKEAEARASDRVRSSKDLSWEAWGLRLNQVMGVYEALFWPDLFILGGGVSKKFARFQPYLKTRARVAPAHFLNEAGMIGAAMAASQLVSKGT